MSEHNKALVRKIYQATETGDAGILDSVVTDDVIEHPLNPGQPPGREALKQIFGGFRVVVPDLRITVEDIIAAGDRAAVRSTVTGTPAGPYLGADPAGRPMRFEAIDIWRIQDGLVAEGWHVEDFVATSLRPHRCPSSSKPRVTWRLARSMTAVQPRLAQDHRKMTEHAAFQDRLRSCLAITSR